MKMLYVVVLAGACLFVLFVGQVAAAHGDSRTASFYVRMEASGEGQGSFLITPAPEEANQDCSRLSLSLALVGGSVAARQVDEFVMGVNTWYEENTFAGFEWAGEPPWQNSGLLPVQTIQGYEAQLTYLFLPHLGLDARWVFENGSTQTDFESFAASGDGTSFAELQGDLSLDLTLSGPMLGLLWCSPVLFTGTSARVFGGVGYFTGTLDWTSSEEWLLQEEFDPPEEWYNLWEAHGRGETIGCFVGGSVTIGLGEGIGIVGALEYRYILIQNMTYTVSMEGAPVVSEVPLPRELDFSSLVTRIGIALSL